MEKKNSLACCTIVTMFICFAVKEILAVLDNGDRFPGQMIAGVGKEREDQDGQSEDHLPPPDQRRTCSCHLQEGNSWSHLHID